MRALSVISYHLWDKRERERVVTGALDVILGENPIYVQSDRKLLELNQLSDLQESEKKMCFL